MPSGNSCDSKTVVFESNTTEKKIEVVFGSNTTEKFEICWNREMFVVEIEVWICSKMKYISDFSYILLSLWPVDFKERVYTVQTQNEGLPILGGGFKNLPCRAR